MSNSDSSRFYVYLHLKPSGEIFYVGKGTGKRAWSRNLRNRHWRHIVDCHGFVVKIHADGLTESQAFELEKQLIKSHKETSKLANVTDGGGGVSGSHVNLGVPKTEAHKEKLRKINTGKKQSQETIAKRKKSMEKLAMTGWINALSKQQNKQIGQKNVNFAGFYITPSGVYESINSAAKANNCTEKAIRIRCRGNTCIVKGLKYTYLPKEGWSFVSKEIA